MISLQLKFFGIRFLAALWLMMCLHTLLVSAGPQLRKPDTIHVKQFQEDQAFNYSEKPETPDLLSRLMNGFYNWLYKQMPENVYEHFWRYIIIAIVIVFAVLITWNLSGAKFNRVIANGLDNSDLNVQGLNVHIDHLDFDKLIDASVKEKNYRLAIRFCYLKILKVLNDQKLIVWQPDKTNANYIHELIEKEVQKNFIGLTLVFDSVWYGNKPLTHEQFEKSRNLFSELANQIKDS